MVDIPPGPRLVKPSAAAKPQMPALLAETVLSPVLLRYLTAYPDVAVDLQVVDRMGAGCWPRACLPSSR